MVMIFLEMKISLLLLFVMIQLSMILHNVNLCIYNQIMLKVKKKFTTSSLNIKLISKVITKILHNLKITFIKF